ncbi:MAG: hypothetical protein NVS3B12_32580 [Acidimicrobiales bacterium]
MAALAAFTSADSPDPVVPPDELAPPEELAPPDDEAPCTALFELLLLQPLNIAAVTAPTATIDHALRLPLTFIVLPLGRPAWAPHRNGIISGPSCQRLC